MRLVIDTNILLLFVIGSWDREAIKKHARTADRFAPRDFDVLEQYLRQYRELVTTPGVLTEAGNLMRYQFHQVIAPTLVAACTPMIEVVRPKGEVFAHPAFDRLGFADVSILLALDDETALLTDDAALFNQALHEEREAANFNHLRGYT